VALGALADARPAPRRAAAALHAVILIASAAAIAIGLNGTAPVEVVAVPVVAGVVALAAARLMLGWTALVGLICVVILFIPIRRYSLPGGLPFELEPYRLLVALVVGGWALSLLSDRRVQPRRTGLEGPLGLFAISVAGSIAFNVDRIAAENVQADVIKRVMFFVSFALVLALVVSVIRTPRALHAIVRVLVISGTIIAAFALYEARSGYNLFDHLNQWIPGLEVADIPDVPGRGARSRVYASAQHPIALGAALAMLLPLAIYLAQTQRRRIWYACLIVIAVGVLATVSRTSIVMLVVVAVIFLWLRPRETRRLWPALILLPILAHVALPGAMGSLREAFFPAGGIVAEQAALPGYRGSGRVADLAPSLAEWKQQPIFGQGFGTRVSDIGRENARILDNQWLGSLLDSGLVGVIALLWLFLRVLRRYGRAAKEDLSDRGWLLTAVTASSTAFAVSMFTYDTFAFVQATVLLFILLGLGSSAYQLVARPAPIAPRLPEVVKAPQAVARSPREHIF
jgi:polysaccharide biosynthesis protein PslJ